jgi:hypothetical protein
MYANNAAPNLECFASGEPAGRPDGLVICSVRFLGRDREVACRRQNSEFVEIQCWRQSTTPTNADERSLDWAILDFLLHLVPRPLSRVEFADVDCVHDTLCSRQNLVEIAYQKVPALFSDVVWSIGHVDPRQRLVEPLSETRPILKQPRPAISEMAIGDQRGFRAKPNRRGPPRSVSRSRQSRFLSLHVPPPINL